MRKLRSAFAVIVLVSAALFAVLLFSVDRALESEREARHRAVAERVFDEMERSLTAILERDDERSRRGERDTREEAALGYFELYDEPRPSYASRRFVDLVARRTILAGARPRPARAAAGTELPSDVPAYRALAALNRGALLRERHDFPYAFGAYDAAVAGDHVVVFSNLSRELWSRSRRESVRRSTDHIEGIVFERRALRDWLAEQTFGEASFVRGFELIDASAPTTSARDAFVHRHRFAEPFDSLAASLTVAPIADASSGSSVHLLAVLLAIAIALGLLAAYRMTAARVRFAERQDQFVSAVTHELRTPLTTLRMYSEMFRDGIVPPESERQYYDAMVSESERLGRLVENVLQQAKLARSDSTGRAEAVAVAPSIEHAITLLAPHARAHGFELVSAIEEDLPPVRGERDAIVQVVVNLVDNAIVHAGASTERRTIELRCERRGEHVVLSVRDHGRGVPEELLEDIFTPFVSAAPNARGVGLGLALVRSLVARMGGVVRAENAAGGGLRITAVLSAA